MHVPNKYRLGPSPVVSAAASLIAKIARIEAPLYRDSGRSDAARALREFARNLDDVADGYSFAIAFEWPAEDDE